MSEIVYLLTNDAMPGLVKIGRTNVPIEQRLRELYGTGVPFPFYCFHASVVEDSLNVERRIHKAFNKFRVNKNREFFEIEPENILEILEMVELQDITPQKVVAETPEDIAAMKKYEKRKDRFSFNLVNIPTGSKLTFLTDDTKESTVLENNKVLFNGLEMSLSQAALEILHDQGKKWKSAHGPAYWVYDGETLSQRRNRLESE